MSNNYIRRVKVSKTLTRWFCAFYKKVPYLFAFVFCLSYICKKYVEFMPEISRFYGIVIKMFFKPKEHEPAHIHALIKNS